MSLSTKSQESLIFSSFVILILLLSTIACNLPSTRIGPQPPSDAPIPSDDALASFKDKWRSLNLSTPNGPFSVSFTEAELTSAMDQAIEQRSAQGDDVPITDPRVVLKDGKIYLYTQLQMDVTQAGGLIMAVPAINENGLVELTIESAEFGPVDIDPTNLQTLADEIEKAINEPLLASPFNIQLTQIVVANGEMTISGTIAQ